MNTLEKIPTGWRVVINGSGCTVNNLIGFGFLDVLLRHPGRRFVSEELESLVGGIAVLHDPEEWSVPSEDELRQHFGHDSVWDEDEGPSPFVSLGYQLGYSRQESADKAAIRQTKRQLAELRKDEMKARGRGDVAGAADRLADEARQIEEFLSKLIDKFGRPREIRSRRVPQAIRDCMRHIREKNPTVADYFRRTVKIDEDGACYTDVDAQWEFVSAWREAAVEVEDVVGEITPDAIRHRPDLTLEYPPNGGEPRIVKKNRKKYF